jgi:molybdenum cofactor synthesis domain-containing protein
MRPIRDTIPFDRARSLLLESVAPIARVERVPLEEADGRVVAMDLTSAGDVPPFDRAAMDGYALRAEDTFGAGRHDPRVLRAVETLHAGQALGRGLAPGECTEIATGAPMPAGADAVVMVEETDRVGDADEVRVFTPVYPTQNVGRRGTDITAGQTIARSGDVLNPSRLGAIAAAGVDALDVYAMPRLAVLSTGNEIAEPGRPLEPGQIYDINRFTLAAVIRRHGGVPVPYPAAPDTIDGLNAAVESCLDEDMLVISGGSSVGERDLILDLLERKGEVVFHGVAVKPGKPTALGRIAGKLVLGMPGYPTSCLSNGYMLLVPALRRIARLPAHNPDTVTLPLAQRIVSTTGRHQFFTIRIADGLAVPAFKQSSDITSMALADGYIEIPAQTDIVEKGELVEVKLL